MSGVIRGLTAFLLLLPLGFIVLGLSVVNPEGRVLWITGAGVVLLYLGIWLYSRPTRFELTPVDLVIVWPIRRARIPRSEIRHVRILEREDLKRELGWGMRIGAGGLWGAFGWLWTSRRGMVDLYISRTDRWVLIERASGRPLLINPEPPEEFVRAAS
jgi:hypothetical protein